MAAVPVPSQPTAAQALALNMRYGPTSGLALQRSEYLADALQNLQRSAAESISTPTALWSKLLADGILQWGKHKADQNAMTAYANDTAAFDKKLLAGTPLDGAPPPTIGAQAAMSPAADASAPPPAAPIQTASLSPVPQAPSGPPTGPALAAALNGGNGTSGPATPDQLKLAQMVWGEARGEPPEGQQAVAAVALNRANKSGKPLADILAAPHQFEGYNAKAQSQNPEALANILANIQPALNGADPTGGAVNFLNPDLQAQLGRQQPSWAPPGQGQVIGHHAFYGGNPQLAQNAPPAIDPAAINAAHQLPPGTLAGDGNPQAPPQAPLPPQFGQLAYSPPGPNVQPPQTPPMQPGTPPAAVGAGADPFAPPPPPASTAGAAPPLAPSSPGPQAGAAGPAPGMQTQPPHNTVTLQEFHTAADLLHNPQTRDLGIQELLKLKMRAAGAMEAPKNMMWDQASGRFVPMPGTETTQLPGQSPSDAPQRDMMGNITHGTIPGVQGSVPEGMVRNPQTGAYEHVTTQQAQTFRMPGVSGIFVTGPDGKPVKVGEDQYGPNELLKMRDNLLGSEPVKLYQQAADAYGSMVAAAKQNPGGMRAYALRDTFARAINPGAVARVGTIQAIRESQGLPAEIKGFLMNLKGDGNVPPEIAQQILDVTQGFVASHYHGAQQLVQSNADYAKRHQIDPADITVPIGDAPQRFVISPPKATTPPAAQGDQAQQAAVLAEIARRKAAGTWKGH